MELEILEDKENKLLKRRELKLDIKHSQSPTPKKQDLVKELAAKYSVPEDHIVIDYIFTKKGTQESSVKAKVYEEAPKAKVKKKKVKEKPKGEVKAVEEKKAEEKPKVVKTEAQASEAK